MGLPWPGHPAPLAAVAPSAKPPAVQHEETAPSSQATARGERFRRAPGITDGRVEEVYAGADGNEDGMLP